MSETAIITESDPRFDNGYDVVNAIIVAKDEYLAARRDDDLLSDDLLSDSMAALTKQWHQLVDQLQRGQIIGRHFSPRRFGPRTRFYIRAGTPRELSREEWIDRAIRLVEARREALLGIAEARLGKRFSFKAFQSSPAPEALAAKLQAVLEERVMAGGPGPVLEAFLDDLEALGHPIRGLHENSGGDARSYAREAMFGYAPVEPGQPARAVELQIDVFMEVEDNRTTRSEIEVSIRRNASPSQVALGLTRSRLTWTRRRHHARNCAPRSERVRLRSVRGRGAQAAARMHLSLAASWHPERDDQAAARCCRGGHLHPQAWRCVMDITEMVDRSREQLSAKLVFGEPVEREGVVMVPAARVRGGGGGGASNEPQAGTGGGFGMTATPAGAFVFGHGKVRWRPAVNPNAIVLGGQIVAATALLVVGSILRQRAAPARGLFGRRLRMPRWMRHRARAMRRHH